MQLFLVANRHLHSKSHQNDFQRALETSVDKKGFFENHKYRGSGEYAITPRGFEEARLKFGKVEPKYEPANKDAFRVTMHGLVHGIRIEIITRGAKSAVRMNGAMLRSAREACQHLELHAGLHLPTEGDSAVRILQDLAIDHGFEIEFV